MSQNEMQEGNFSGDSSKRKRMKVIEAQTSPFERIESKNEKP
jgi:hypothetical protein